MGLTQWVQLITGSRRRQLNDGTWQKILSPGLDGGYPYSSGTTAEDAPAVKLTSALAEVDIDDSFTMYLMFKPIDIPVGGAGIFVPLKVTTWGWSADAIRNETTWSLSGTPSKTTPSTSDATEYPIWNQVVDANNWVNE